MKNLIPELSFKDIEAGDVNAVNALNAALHDHGFFLLLSMGCQLLYLIVAMTHQKNFLNWMQISRKNITIQA